MDITKITTLDLWSKSERAQIRRDVKGVLSEHGVDLEDAQYRLVEDTANTFHFVIPDKQRFDEFASVDLGDLAAGKRKSTFSTAGGSLSTVLPK